MHRKDRSGDDAIAMKWFHTESFIPGVSWTYLGWGIFIIAFPLMLATIFLSVVAPVIAIIGLFLTSGAYILGALLVQFGHRL